MQYEARLNQPLKDGKSLRSHLESAARQGVASARARLDGAPERPEELGYLWEWSNELAASRNVTQAGIEPLTYLQIDAWARLTCNQPAPHEVRSLLALDWAQRHPGEEGRD